MKSWLQDNDIEIYSTYTEGKSVVNISTKKVFVIKMFMLLVILTVKTLLELFTKGITKKKKTKRILEFKKY